MKFEHCASPLSDLWTKIASSEEFPGVLSRALIFWALSDPGPDSMGQLFHWTRHELWACTTNYERLINKIK